MMRLLITALIAAALALSACSANTGEQPVITAGDGLAMAVRETSCNIGLEAGPKLNLGCTIKWGRQ